jgi:hypothetical protein
VLRLVSKWCSSQKGEGFEGVADTQAQPNKNLPENGRVFSEPVFLKLWQGGRTMRKKSRGTHENRIISMSVLSPTHYLTTTITQSVPRPELNFNLNETVTDSEKVPNRGEASQRTEDQSLGVERTVVFQRFPSPSASPTDCFLLFSSFHLRVWYVG